MNNIFVFCELDEGKIADVSQELLTKGRSLANELNCNLEAVVIGYKLEGIESQIAPYGADTIHVADDKRLEHYLTLPFTTIIVDLFKKNQPQIALFGATSVGRDLGPRVSSALQSGLTADCTSLVIGDHEDKKAEKVYKNLLYQIRPAFGGNIIATIINPDCRPQMATVREGVMKKEIFNKNHKAKVASIEVNKVVTDTDFLVEIIERHMEPRKIDIKKSQVIVAGGYGVGSRENFNLLFDLAHVLGGEVGASRAAVDAGFVDHARQVGQTGVTVRPKLYIACGISGQVQHTAGMEESAMIIAINTDPTAPINKIADYAITGEVSEVIPRLIEAYKKFSK
ncbi:MAG TPA: electron transfer flavoprotein subunit alpha [Marinilabiliales bacterium]|jgi:electron transfer flavoprotein alpha subunit|nr:electron transfer flavoprotein subunit alpha/FixB family protein [Salinivirgaceae bacterium]OFX41267.1 MAG: electron transfer flavoprotein subunit alpha [Bacteroidetes bacterium GWA2_40_14]OFX61956.1 MAG: electron transfer flavoprotein subunit alpha [Bacteroidetes bacterium GWC2_40_13]OFX74103.1 MAG: electron transfer flavoprotein subunit alpha [Bacteroidetes bacterium GWD2_40_43]OFX93063.1 MAG: electron transfer flavoprotein subunit alpha [Bacteroidetes bacterium GWE2_40_63]OFY21433.1 MAG: